MSQEEKKNEEKEPQPFKWDVWLTKAIEIGLVIITVFSFWETQKSTQSAQVSAKAAQDALSLQQRQYEDSKEQEKLRSIEESEKRKKDIELIQQQILALKSQAKALERGVKNTEISQRPYLDVANFGFYIRNEMNTDSVVLSYNVSNYGVRPAILKTPNVYILNEEFKIIGNHKKYANTTIIKEKTFAQTIRLGFGEKKCLICDIDDILKAGNLYFCFVFEYYDPFISENILNNTKPIFYKWISRNKTELLKYSTGKSIYYSPDLCTDEKEIEKIVWSIKNN